MAQFKPTDNTFRITSLTFDNTRWNVHVLLCLINQRGALYLKVIISSCLTFPLKILDRKCQNRNILVSKKNPDIGLTIVEEHQIHINLVRTRTDYRRTKWKFCVISLMNFSDKISSLR